MKNIIKHFFILFICVTGYMLHVTWVNAEELKLELTPSSIEIVAKPNSSINQQYTLTNKGDPMAVKIEVLPFEIKDSTGQVVLGNRLDGLIGFTLDSQEAQSNPVLLKTNEIKRLTLGIQVPEGLPEQDYYYSLVVVTNPPPIPEGVVSVRAKISLASHLLITVTSNGQIEIKPKITLFEPRSGFNLKAGDSTVHLFDSFDSIPIVLLVHNTGKNLIQAKGTIVEKGFPFGIKKYEIKSQTILAQSQRLFLAASTLAMNNEPTNKLAKDSLLLKGFHLGLYDLSTSINSGKATPTIYGRTFLLALPFKLFGVIFIVVGIIFFFLKKLPNNRDN